MLNFAEVCFIYVKRERWWGGELSLFVRNSEANVGPGLQIIHAAFIYGLGSQSDWGHIMLHYCGV